jgi:hypothetical protein
MGIVDISDLAMPELRGYLDLPESTNAIALRHGVVLTANSQNGLYVIDVSDPGYPVQVNHCEAGTQVFNDIQDLRGLACVVSGDEGGLRVLDPATCEEVGYYDTPGQAVKLAVADSLVFVADGDGGICILEYLGPNRIEGPSQDAPPSPGAFALLQNYPNPFNPSTTISYHVPGGVDEHERVTLSVYDLRGRLVKELVDAKQASGTHLLSWDGSDSRGFAAPSGIYFARLDARGQVSVRKMIMIR